MEFSINVVIIVIMYDREFKVWVVFVVGFDVFFNCGFNFV